MNSVFLFFVFIVVSLSNGFKDHSDSIVTYDPEDNPYPCICPGVNRPVCTIGPSGSIIKHDNICFAKCNSLNNFNGSKVFTVHSRSLCKNVLPDFNNTHLEQWIKEMEEEIKFYTPINKLMNEILELSSAGAPPCVCPPINRPLCQFGPSGAIVEKYSNICSLKCDYITNRHNRKTFGINPLLCDQMKNMTTETEGSLLKSNSRKDNNSEEWIESMKKEVEFYRKFNGVLDGLF